MSKNKQKIKKITQNNIVKDNVDTNNGAMTIINFNKQYVAPTNKWNKSRQLIEWGSDNNYPEYLLNLYNYNGSSIHTKIINTKNYMLTGQGFEDVLDINLNKFIYDNQLTEEVKKASLDYEIFNGFAFEIVWSKAQTIKSIKHIPISQLRFGLLNDDNQFDYFWYSKDWKQTRKFIPETIMAYNDLVKVGTQVYFYAQYNPQNILVNYPIAGYVSSINSIETEYEISKFHLNQAKQGYYPSFMVSFADGVPTQEEQDAFYDSFTDNFAGTENAGKAFITYSKSGDNRAVLSKIDLNDSDERFMMLSEQLENKIVQGADIPPQLVILTPGKLGSTDEVLELKKSFQETYIAPRQNSIEFVLNNIISNNNYSDKLILKKFSV